MKKNYKSSLFYVCLFVGALGFNRLKASEDFLKTTIMPFKDGRKAALTLTFDDGTLDHLTTGLPLLDKYGFKGTFFLVVKWTKDSPEKRYLNRKKNKYMIWNEWKELLKQGHEIGNHSMTHYQLVKAKDRAALEYEIIEPIGIIKEHLGITPVSFCYPGNSRSEEIADVVMAHHIAETKHRYFYGGDKFNVETANGWIDKAIRENSAIIAMLHALEKDAGYAPFKDIKLFDEHLAYIKSRESEIWVDTLANVTKYRKLYENSRIETVQASENMKSLKLVSTLDLKKYDVPLTLCINSDGHGIVVSQNSRNLPLRKCSESYLVNVMPGSNVVVKYVK